MPPIGRVEEFHKCMYSTENLAVYCIVRTAIKPDSSSDLWRQIEIFSNDTKRHFRHDILQAGLCLNNCEAQLKTLNASVLESLNVEEFNVNYTVSKLFLYQCNHYTIYESISKI